jgi:pimeloyl-[acyl-carrier protein] methyl ester esterase
MKEIIAMHGWAGDSNQWSTWIDCFQDWEWQTAERGYKDLCPYTPKWNNKSNQSGLARVAICHSLGSHLIDKEILYSANHVVLINSFSRFIPTGKENRSVTTALNRMMHTINTPNEESMLRKFHIKAHKPNNINIESNGSNILCVSDSGRLKLKNDLKLLINSDSLPTGLNADAKVLIINSNTDYILASETKKKLAEDLTSYLKQEPTIINFQDEGHSISKLKNIKRIKHWLEFNHAKNMV